MVDRSLLARKVDAIRHAIGRIRTVLPHTPEAFLADPTARESVVLNLFVASQEMIDLATHWLADEGWTIPASYREAVLALGEHDVLDRALAARLAAFAGLRNLVAHRYGVIDWRRVHAVAAAELGDLEAFCAALAAAADRPAGGAGQR